MAKGRAYDNLYVRLETKEGEKELYRLARQRDRAGKDVQHVRVIKDENGNVMVNSEAVLKQDHLDKKACRVYAADAMTSRS